MVKQPKQTSNRKQQNPFKKYMVGGVSSVIVFSVAFTIMMFKTNTVMKVTQEQRQASKDIETPMTYEVSVREIEDKKTTNLGGIGESGDGGSEPNLPGIPDGFGSTINVDASQMYQDVKLEVSSGEIMNNGLPLRDGWPTEWGDSNVTFINWPGLVDKWYEDAAAASGTSVDDIRKQSFSVASDKHCDATLANIDGVTCLPMCYYPAMCIPDYYELSFSGNEPAWSGEIARQYYACLVIENPYGDTAYIPITESDNKGHTSPGGILQTFVKQAPAGPGSWNLANTLYVNGSPVDQNSAPGFTYIGPYLSHSYGSGDGANFYASTADVLGLFSKGTAVDLYYKDGSGGIGACKPHGSIETNSVFNNAMQTILNEWNLKGIVVKHK